ncbi:glutaredoxin domain-containing protein [Dactylosporangium sp. NPDC051541]|uniref:glutaredoxin domain-containing protein n=1 Tax=Dactylosporangium sp. NPDC051541 TaxID=3363977 RepID=UPI0037934EA2
MRRWTAAIFILLVGGVLVATEVAQREAVPAVFFSVVFLVLAVAVSPRGFPKSLPAEEAQRRSAEDGRGIVYWRPGCPYCVRLRTSLGRRARRLHWVDIWADPQAAAAVRALADGNETVPTVVFGAESRVNPAPAWVKAQL